MNGRNIIFWRQKPYYMGCSKNSIRHSLDALVNKLPDTLVSLERSGTQQNLMNVGFCYHKGKLPVKGKLRLRLR